MTTGFPGVSSMGGWLLLPEMSWQNGSVWTSIANLGAVSVPFQLACLEQYMWVWYRGCGHDHVARALP